MHAHTHILSSRWATCCNSPSASLSSNGAAKFGKHVCIAKQTTPMLPTMPCASHDVWVSLVRQSSFEKEPKSYRALLQQRLDNSTSLFIVATTQRHNTTPQHNATQGAQPSTTHGAGAHKRLGKHDDGTLRASTYSCSSVKGDPGVPTGLTRWHKLYSVDFFGAWWRGRGRGGREGRERGNFLSCAHIYTRTHTPVHTCC